MVGVDALTTWLLQRLTESSVRRLRALVFGTELEQALRKISSSALKDTAEQLQAENSEEFILVVAQVFSAPSIETDTSDQELTVLETLISGIRTQVAVLDDRDQTGTGRSAADILGVPGARIANALATNVVDGIRRHALSGGPLLPLSQQLNSDITRLQVKDSHDEIMDALRSLIQDRGRRPRLKRPPGRRNEGSAEATLPKSIEIKIPTKRGIRHTLFAVAVHPNSQWIAVGSSGSATLWDISTGEKISRAFLLGGGCSYSVAFSPDGKLVAVGDQSWGAMVREVPSGRVVVDVHKGQLYENRHWDLVWSVAFSSAGSFLATAGLDCTVRTWEIPSGKEIAVFPHDNQPTCVALSPNDWLLATGSEDGTARIWDLRAREVRAELSHDGSVRSVAFSPDSYLLATGSYDKTARLWNISTKETIALVNHEDTVSSVAFSPVSKNMWATASRDTTAKLWGTSTGSEPREFRHSESVASIAFSPDGRLLVTGCEEMEVYVWPLDNARITG